MLELQPCIHDPRMCYTIFYQGSCHRYSFEKLSDKIDRLPYRALVSKRLLDTLWIQENIVHEYLGILHSGTAHAPFYFYDETDSFIFTLKYCDL